MSNPHHQTQRMLHSLRSAINDERAASWLHINQAFLGKGFHGFPNGGTAGAELLSKFALGGQTISAAQFAAQDTLLDLLRNLFVDFTGLNGTVHASSLKVLPRKSWYDELTNGHRGKGNIWLWLLSIEAATNFEARASLLRTVMAKTITLFG